MSTHNVCFSPRNKKNINTFSLKSSLSGAMIKVMGSNQMRQFSFLQQNITGKYLLKSSELSPHQELC